MAYKVTPWEVSGDIDYGKIVKDFGLETISDHLLKRIEKHTRELHPLLRRGVFFAHRDLNWILDEYEKGHHFFLYTGRGPSGHTHLGHILPWVFTQWLQEKFGADLWFQMTDDEKFLFKDGLELEQTKKLAYENALDVIALGFDEKKTKIFLDTEYAKTLYPQALKVAKRLTFSTAKAAFGFSNESNVGEIFFTSIQAVPAFLPSVLKGKNIPCLIPHAVDQDPHFRVARDILPKLGHYKPASIQCTMLPGLKGGGKMSASEESSAIYTTDSLDVAKKKVMSAFTGGRDTIKEQKEKGANYSICPIYHYYRLLFMPDDKELANLERECKGGSILCGECKQRLSERVAKFLSEHQHKREKAKARIEKFMIRD
jgi:tryptophanyl-tRNA synthetase